MTLTLGLRQLFGTRDVKNAELASFECRYEGENLMDERGKF